MLKTNNILYKWAKNVTLDKSARMPDKHLSKVNDKLELNSCLSVWHHSWMETGTTKIFFLFGPNCLLICLSVFRTRTLSFSASSLHSLLIETS